MEMISQSGWLLLAVLAAISTGALLKGMMGLGLPLFAVPILATLTSVQEAVLLMVIPGIAANLWVVIDRRRNLALLRQHVLFLVCGIAGAYIGTALLNVVNDRALKVLLVIWLAIYLAQYFVGKKPLGVFAGRGPLAYLVGLIAGASQGASGISAQVVAPYFHGRSLQAPAYAFLVAFTFLLLSITQLTAALSIKLLNSDLLKLSLIALIPTIIFTRLGIRLADSISLEVFNKVLLAVLCLMEVKLLLDLL